MRIPVLILGAGASSRMRGRDKLAELVDGVPLLRAQAQKALQISDLVLIALPSADHPRAALLTGLPVTILPVPEASEGLSGTLRGAVAALPACDRFMVLLADLPDITADDLRQVIDAAGKNPDAVICRGATTAGRPGHPILFAADLRPAFAGLSGDAGGEAVVRAERARTVLVPLPGERALRDLDTPEDWAAWRAEKG